jgi:hypothetical protein
LAAVLASELHQRWQSIHEEDEIPH